MYDRCIYFNLSTLNRKISKIWQDEFNLLGFSPSHGYLLAAMAKKPSATQKELSEIMELDASTITRFIDQLHSKKLIEKLSTGKGARFALTPQGFLLSKRTDELMDSLFANMQDKIGKNELSNIVDGLRQTKEIFQES